MQVVVVTPTPRLHFEGVINQRGRVLPVVDLAARLALAATERARSARVVVIDGGSERIGLLVDGVSEVLRVSSSDFGSICTANLLHCGVDTDLF
jgi:purine-binding chemotaxis protein CheW